jgi:hypothetical protein
VEVGIPKIDMKEIRLYRNDAGEIVDSEGQSYLLAHKPEAAINNVQWITDGGLDISGSVTITGNLVVQQSEWVYLRGPITGSAARINGPITAQSAEIGGIDLLQKLNELETQIKKLKDESGL